MTTVIVCEKPAVAKKVRNAITDPDVEVVSARGHLVEVAFPKTEKEWTYPVIIQPDSLKLEPIHDSVKVLDNIGSSCLDADVLVSATDLDREGSSIFLEILKFLQDLNEEFDPVLKRMEMSSLTETEIKSAWSNLKEFDWGRSYAGFTRNVQDMHWGINLTRALTLATRNMKGILSGGRVQTPMLKLIVEKDREIEKFVSRPYYQLTMMVEFGLGKKLDMLYEGKITSPEQLKDILDSIKAGDKVVLHVDDKEQKIPPPPPFSGTMLQIEGNRALGLSAKEIADRQNGLAQSLYEKGICTYPGTDSEKYPLDWKDKDLDSFKTLLSKYVKEHLPKDNPVEGDAVDPAHPCIRPVSLPTSDLSDKEMKLYDLIARRCAAGFEEPCIESVKSVRTVIDGHRFRAFGKSTKSEGWRKVYPFIKSQEKDIPDVRDGESGTVSGSRHQMKETQPPSKYNVISLIAHCDKLGLGTKNTRPGIIDKLSERGYVETHTSGKKTVLTATDDGKRVADVIDKYAELMTDAGLTEMFNASMDDIEKDPDLFLPRNKDMLDRLLDTLNKFKANERSIGFEITGVDIGSPIKCPKCGKDMTIRKSKDGKYKFFGCMGYPDCDKSMFFQDDEILRFGIRCGCGLPLISGDIEKRGEFVRCLDDKCDRSPLRCRKCGRSIYVGRSKKTGKLYARCGDCNSFDFLVDLDRVVEEGS